MSTKGEPTHRGTLVCVVLKAKNLPNKKSIGKQDPYCTLQLGTHSQKTKPDKRGGQHPTWDEQLHFEIFDDMEEQLRNAIDAAGSSGTSSPKKSRTKTTKMLRVACYADDTKEPEFIGDGLVDLTDTLKSGEFDEWVTIKAKDRYAGEVYLELTFYSAAAPPKRKKNSQPIVPTGTTYGGAGTFSEDINEHEFAPRPTHRETGHAPIPSYMRPETQQSLHGHGHRSNNSSGMNASKSHAQLGGLPSAADEIPQSLRPSASLAQLDTYTPPYAPPQIQREKSPAPSSYIDQHRNSLPPNAQLYGHRLSDATSPSVQAQQYIQDAARYGHSHSISASQQQPIPQSTSVSTLRPSYPDGYDGTADDLIRRPLSSMSINSRPVMVEQVAPHHDAYQPHYTHAAPVYPAQSSYAPGPSSSVDQFGRPAPPLHSYSALPATSHINTQFPASTPPPPPNSAPPSSVYHLQGQPQYMGSPHQQSSLPPAPLLNTVMPPGRPTSAADMVSPNRPLSSANYHALPMPPAPSAIEQQQQHEQTLYHQQQQAQHEQNYHHQMIASPAEYAQPSYPSSNGPQLRPLPHTAMAPSSSSSFAPLAPASNYYPPPAQTPSHYISPTPMMPWTAQQGAAVPSAYSSYPPPPPGPDNGGYVHAGPLQTSPSTHPSQYPPPPPMHHVDYSQQQQQQHPYYAPPQSPLPPPQALPPNPQQQPTQTYYRPQAQHPY